MAKTFFGSTFTQFMDPVHGGIGALKHEVSCINHPLFQRLRYIFQNDVAHFVFPGATHTRFTHSIGVMHLAGRLYRVLIEQYSTENEEEFQYTEKHVDAIYYVYCCFRLAALLHDTGHFPFSHEFENNELIKKELLSNKSILKDFWGKSDLYNKYQREDRFSNNEFCAAHEDYSLAVAYKILSAVNDKEKLPVEIDDVLCLMEKSSHKFTTTFEEKSKLLFEVFEGLKSPRLQNYEDVKIAEGMKKFFSLMISGEIDVDKMDYLLRDSYFSGAKYGVYNLDHLLSTLRIGFNPNADWIGLAILEKGVIALEDFIYSRFQIYKNMWSHKAVVGSKLLLLDALELCLKEDNIAMIKNHINDDKNFLYFTDHYFMELFRQKSKSNNNNSATKRFLFRERYKQILRLENPNQYEINEKLIELKRKYGENVKYRKSIINFSEISSQENSIQILTRQNSKSQRKLIPLNRATDFFEKFKEVLFVNFYLIE